MAADNPQKSKTPPPLPQKVQAEQAPKKESSAELLARLDLGGKKQADPENQQASTPKSTTASGTMFARKQPPPLPALPPRAGGTKNITADETPSGLKFSEAEMYRVLQARVRQSWNQVQALQVFYEEQSLEKGKAARAESSMTRLFGKKPEKGKFPESQDIADLISDLKVEEKKMNKAFALIMDNPNYSKEKIAQETNKILGEFSMRISNHLTGAIENAAKRAFEKKGPLAGLAKKAGDLSDKIKKYFGYLNTDPKASPLHRQIGLLIQRLQKPIGIQECIKLINPGLVADDAYAYQAEIAAMNEKLHIETTSNQPSTKVIMQERLADSTADYVRFENAVKQIELTQEPELAQEAAAKSNKKIVKGIQENIIPITKADVQWVVDSVEKMQKLNNTIHDNKKVFLSSLRNAPQKENFNKLVKIFAKFQNDMDTSIEQAKRNAHNPIDGKFNEQGFKKKEQEIINDTYKTLTEQLQSRFESGYSLSNTKNEADLVKFLNRPDKQGQAHYQRLIGLQLNHVYQRLGQGAHPDLLTLGGKTYSPHGKNNIEFMRSPMEAAKEERLTAEAALKNVQMTEADKKQSPMAQAIEALKEQTLKKR